MTDFLQRVVSYPVVSSALSNANDYYAWAKDSNAYVRSCAEVTESYARQCKGGAEPLLRIFEDRVKAVDQLACRQLDRLEASCPAVNEPTDKVAQMAKDYYCQAWQPRLQLAMAPFNAAAAAASVARSYSQRTGDAARSLGAAQCRRLLRRLLLVLAAADRGVDACLPLGEGEGSNGEGGNYLEAADEDGKENEEVEITVAVIELCQKLRRRLPCLVTRPVNNFNAEFRRRVGEAEGEEASERLGENAAAYVKRCRAVGLAGARMAVDGVGHLRVPEMRIELSVTDLRMSELLRMPQVPASIGAYVERRRQLLSRMTEFVSLATAHRILDYLFDTFVATERPSEESDEMMYNRRTPTTDTLGSSRLSAAELEIRAVKVVDNGCWYCGTGEEEEEEEENEEEVD